MPPLSTSCSPVTKLNLERSENFGRFWSNVSGKHKAKGGILNFTVEGLSIFDYGRFGIWIGMF